MNLGPEYPELLADLAVQLRDLLTKSGMPADKAEQTARAAAEHVRLHWGGQIVYVPTGSRYETRQQWSEIWSKFNGKNVSQLAQEFRKTEVQIYYILRQMREQMQRELQPDLLESSKPV